MFPHLIKLVGPIVSVYDLKYHLENILNPLKQVRIIHIIDEVNFGVYIVSFNGVSGILQNLYPPNQVNHLLTHSLLNPFVFLQYLAE